MSIQRHFVALSAVLALSSAAVRADVAVLTSSKDATLFDDGVGNRANGANFSFYAGRAGTLTAWPVRRGLVAFDVSSIPPGSTITNVQLRLYMSQTTSGAKTFTAHRVTSGWNEGPTVGFSGNGGAAAAGDVTWLHTFWNNQFWNSPGGDFVASASASTSVSAVGYYTWGSTAQMVADVQGWVNSPSTSQGWILIGPEQAGQKSAKQFEARESLAQYRPQLTVTYSPPAPSVYCTARTNSLGCVPAMSFSGTPDADAGSGFALSASNIINNKSGVLFYGVDGATALPFQGGFLCVKAPTTRTPAQNSLGSSPPAADCSGTFAFDFNARIAAGVDARLVAGVAVAAQYWSRDPAASFTTNLTNAVSFVILP